MVNGTYSTMAMLYWYIKLVAKDARLKAILWNLTISYRAYCSLFLRMDKRFHILC